ncbi:hypothetical protein [Natrinema sp. SYSU A 869]|uniref:hypothetical protein n=1 Tax=Natrinema sp. SYSU A 869 TaxID=2871694 RepID=UPI001CA45F53|nr:hypothetical protein [Natrinema sp. SYSU A 869]
MSEGYILNALQTPALLRPVYESVQDGNVTQTEIGDDTGLDDDAVKQATDGLRYVRLLGREDGEYYVVEPPWAIEDPQLAFRMAILHSLAGECTPGDWGTQAVVLLNYQYLLQYDVQYFEANDEVLYDAINTWHRDEKNYVPMSSQGEIDLNENKFVNWARIVDYLGLVHKARGREHTVYPDSEIIATSVSLAVEETGTDGHIGITEYLGWLRENLLPVELTSGGEVPAPLARVLYNLVRDGRLRIVEYGDAEAVSLARTPKRNGIATEANTLEVVAE